MVKYDKKQIDALNMAIKKHFPHVYTIDKTMQITQEGISRMVMLDRYTQKDAELKSLTNGDLVVVKIKDDAKFPTLGIGYIVKITIKNVLVRIEQQYWAGIDATHNHSNGVIKISKSLISKPLEIYYEQIARRVGNALALNDTPDWGKKFEKEIISLNIVPAGRVLYGAGSDSKVTYFNCYVMPMPQDSRSGISKHREEVMEIMSRGGGVGTNGSTLRPKDTIAISVGGKSSGAVSWLNDLSSLTDLVQQGGSRRGAQMIMMNDWHPDIVEFIVSKMQKGVVLKWISENFESPLIKAEAKRKLNFTPLSSQEKTIHTIISNNSTVEESIKNKSKATLAQGGEYSVNSPQFLSGANISVGITKEFMSAVKGNKEWTFRFPDIAHMSKEQKDFYDREWHNIGDVREWEKLGYPVKKYATLKARELWDLINFCATYSAEPGVFFIDRANKMTNATSYNQKVVCTNPCGEQPLAPYSVCNLAALNLANFVDKKNGEPLWDKLEKTIAIMVRMQDNVIDATPYFLDANKHQAIGERRVGMGVMGLHDFLIWTNNVYGSKSGNKLIDKLFERIATVAYMTSADLSKEKGSFPFLRDIKDFMKTGFVEKLPEKVRQHILKVGGMRNSHLLTIAPTGSTGTMVGVSTGLEPYFAFKYFRSGRLGKFMEVEQDIVQEYRNIKNIPKESKLPATFITAMELSPEAHADVQSIIQRWVDSSISKTVNAPKGYTVKQVEKIYMRLYNGGAKGGTVYVDGSRDAQVLSLTKSDVSSTEDVVISHDTEKKTGKIAERHADVPSNKLDREMGVNIGDLCPICKEGTVENLGGCNSCTNCQAQLKCGL